MKFPWLTFLWNLQLWLNSCFGTDIDGLRKYINYQLPLFNSTLCLCCKYFRKYCCMYWFCKRHSRSPDEPMFKTFEKAVTFPLLVKNCSQVVMRSSHVFRSEIYGKCFRKLSFTLKIPLEASEMCSFMTYNGHINILHGDMWDSWKSHKANPFVKAAVIE